MSATISFGRVRIYNQVVLQGNVKCFSCYNTKVVTYNKKLQPIKSHKPLNTCHVRSRDKLKIFYLHHHHTYIHQSWQCGYIK